MENLLFLIYLAVILVSVIMAFMARKELFQRKVGIVIPYLTYVFVQESTLKILSLSGSIVAHPVIYNFYRLLTVIVFAMIFYNISFLRNSRRLILLGAIAYTILTIIVLTFFTPLNENSQILGLARGFIITFFGVLFLFGFFQIDNRTEERYWRPILWFTIGVVIFYPVISITISLQKYLHLKDATLFGFNLYNLVPQIMSMFLYTCFTYAFYKCRKTNL